MDLFFFQEWNTRASGNTDSTDDDKQATKHDTSSQLPNGGASGGIAEIKSKLAMFSANSS